MRLEEKTIDGGELVRREQRESTPLEEKYRQELPALAGEALRTAGDQRHDALFEVMRAILDDRTLEIGALDLPQREARALDALQVAVTARSSDMHQFVYAEDRRTLLEQALAVLQPELTSRDRAELAEMQAQLTELTTRVSALRDEILALEDGQAETIGVKQVESKAEDTETDDEADDKAGHASLYGPERPAKKAKPTTLGDQKDIEAAARKQAWWKRPSGG